MSDANQRLALWFKWLYSLVGLGVFVVCELVGAVLFLSGVGGSSQFVFKALGIAEASATDAGPGVVLCLVGAIVLLTTRFKVDYAETEKTTQREVPKFREPDPPEEPTRELITVKR